VADWGQRPKDKDRDDAIKVIEAAAARGQIIDADKAKRIQEVKQAGTMGDIDMVTRGLALAAPAAPVAPIGDAPPAVSAPGAPVNPTFQQYAPPTTPPVTEPDPPQYVPPTNVQYGAPVASSAGTTITTPPMIRKSGGGGKLALIIVLIVLAGIAVPVIFGIRALVDTVNDGIDSIDDLTPGKPDMYTVDAIDELIEDVEGKTGSTEVFQVGFYDGYAVVTAPADATSERYISYYWDGDLSESTKGNGVYQGRFDMKKIDPEVIIKLHDDARRLVEGAIKSNYVFVTAPGDDGGAINASATNDFGETGNLIATFDGKIITRIKP
jgi:hypothetical protein